MYTGTREKLCEHRVELKRHRDIYIYIYIHTHIYVYTHTWPIWARMYMHTCMHVHTCICAYVYMHIHICKNDRMLFVEEKLKRMKQWIRKNKNKNTTFAYSISYCSPSPCFFFPLFFFFFFVVSSHDRDRLSTCFSSRKKLWRTPKIRCVAIANNPFSIFFTVVGRKKYFEVRDLPPFRLILMFAKDKCY